MTGAESIEDEIERRVSLSREALDLARRDVKGSSLKPLSKPHGEAPSESLAEVQDIEQCFVDLRLRDGLQKPYPYALDTGRIYSYTKLRFYKRGKLGTHVGEICLFGATVTRPDSKRPVFHLKVPNFTYYLRTFDEDALTTRLSKWIHVANTPYTSTSQIFLTISVKLHGKEHDNHEGPRSQHTAPVGHLREGSIKVGTLPAVSWEMKPTTVFSVVLLRMNDDQQQDVQLTFHHTSLGILTHVQQLRLREITGLHAGDGGGVPVTLCERSRKVSGTAFLQWEVAPERYLRLRCNGHNLWRRDFIRSDPFFRIRRVAVPQDKGQDDDALRLPPRHHSHHHNDSTTTIYRSEAYRNLANPAFLPVHLGVPLGFVLPEDAGCSPKDVVLTAYDASAGGSEKVDWLAWIGDEGLGKRGYTRYAGQGAVSTGPLQQSQAEVAATEQMMAEIDTAVKPVPVLNDNESRWPAVGVAEPLLVEVWDNNWSRSARVARPTLMGTFEMTLEAVLPSGTDLLTAPEGELPRRVRVFQLARSAKYNDDEPPPTSEKARLPLDTRRGGHTDCPPLQRIGRGPDSSNAQSTVLPTPDSRLRSHESKVTVDGLSLHELPSFLHFIKGRWCAELVAAIDFTTGSQAVHKIKVLPTHNMFQVVLAVCLRFLAPYTGRGGADLYGFCGIQSSNEYQVFPVHKHEITPLKASVTPEQGDDDEEEADLDEMENKEMISRSSLAQEDNASRVSEGSQGGDELAFSPGLSRTTDVTDQQGTSLQLGYSRAREQMQRVAEPAFPVFLLPVIRVSAARVREIAKTRKRNVAETKKLFAEAMKRKHVFNTSSHRGTHATKLAWHNSLKQWATFLDTVPHHTFGVGVVVIGSNKEIADVKQAVEELRRLEKAKVPFLFYILFLDCAAPPDFQSLLNCITVDLSTAPSLVQVSLHLLAKALGFFPSRLVDFMRLHRIEPQIPQHSYRKTVDEIYQGLSESITLSPPKQASPGTKTVAPPVSQDLRHAEEEEEEEVEEQEEDADVDRDNQEHLRHLFQRSEFNITSSKFLQIFNLGKEREEEVQEDKTFPLSGGDSADRRYKKAVSTKGHEVYALVTDNKTDEALSSPKVVPQDKDLTVVDLYMADAQLSKKERADQRLREYVYEKTAQRRKSSGLALAHARLLRMREESTNTSEGKNRASIISAASDSRRRFSFPKKKLFKRKKPGLKEVVASAGQRFNDLDSVTSTSSEEEDMHPLARRMQTAKKGTSAFRKMVRRGSVAAVAPQPLAPSPPQHTPHPPSHHADETTTDDGQSQPVASSKGGPRIPSNKLPEAPTYYAYKGPSAGCLKPFSRTVDFLQKDYRSLGNGLKVDWNLDKTKQAELRAILSEKSEIHAGPPIEMKSKAELQEEVRRVSFFADAASRRHGRHRPATARTK